MDPFQTLGIVIAALIAIIITCLCTYALNLMWVLTLPCQGLYYLCGAMKYNDDDEGVCVCDGNCIV